MRAPHLDARARWRLVLGEAAEPYCSGALGAQGEAIDAALEWLYGRDPERARRGERRGGSQASTLTTPDWIAQVHTLFPKRVIERLERDAVERFAIDDLVTNPEALARATPNVALLRAVLRTKHLMAPQVLAQARAIVEAVTRELVAKLAREAQIVFSGVRDRRRRTMLKSAGALDIRRALLDNLKHWDPERRRLGVERLVFNARMRKRMRPWRVILLVDQSASMLGSTIHSAVLASCLWRLPGVRAHLVAFDTAVVDLTRDVDDPVELLMRVQLGGGTDIAQAIDYAAQLIDEPARTIVALVSDLFEGGSQALLVRRVGALVESGARVLALAALDEDCAPAYDRDMGARLAAVGARVGAMTPFELIEFLVQAVQD